MFTTLVVLLVSLLATHCEASCPVPGYFISHPQNLTVSVGQTGVNLTCNLNVQQAWVWSQRVGTVEVFTSSGVNLNGKAFTIGNPSNNYPLGALIYPNPIKITDHGMYQCRYTGCADSYIGQLNVEGTPQLNFFPLNTQLNFTLTAGSNDTRTILTYGYPSPTFTLRKKSSGGGYTDITASEPTFTVNSETLTMSGVERSHSGDYQIVATNSHGSYMLNFTLTVTGVGPPCPTMITPTSSPLTPTQYNSEVVMSCSTPEDSYNPDSQNQLQILWRHENQTEITSNEYFEVTNIGNTQRNLRIKMLTTDLNGKYICFAENTRASCTNQVVVIGPPEPISDLNATRSGNGYVILTWTPPRSFGAGISMYEIKYRLNGGAEMTVSVTSVTDTRQFCSSGNYQFRVIAINEHDARSDESNVETVTIAADECSTPSTSASGTVGVFGSTSPSATPTETLTDPSSGGQSTSGIIAGAVSGLALLAVVTVLAVLAYCYVAVIRKRSSGHVWSGREESPDFPVSPQFEGKSPEPNGILAGLPSPIPLVNGYMPAPYSNNNIDPRFEFPRENLEFTDVLFDGKQTVIYKATARGIKDEKCIDVAVKAIKDDFVVYDEYVSALLLEMEELAQLEPHPNVVGLIRVCTVGRPLYMVMEYMCHGDLLGFLRSTRGHENMYTVMPCNDNPPVHLKLTSRDLLRIATQIACGMQFLSERKIVHGALCARNILVTNSMEVKVFNIGCHSLYNEEPFESLEKWLAPENIANGQRTTYGDVWSYGVLLWEVVTVGGTPYSEINCEDLYEQLQAGMRLPRPPHCAQPVYNIMEECWKQFPQERPLFSDIYDTLDQLNLSKMSYLDLRSYDKTAYSQFDNEMSLTSAL